MYLSTAAMKILCSRIRSILLQGEREFIYVVLVEFPSAVTSCLILASDKETLVTSSGVTTRFVSFAVDLVTFVS